MKTDLFPRRLLPAAIALSVALLGGCSPEPESNVTTDRHTDPATIALPQDAGQKPEQTAVNRVPSAPTPEKPSVKETAPAQLRNAADASADSQEQSNTQAPPRADHSRLPPSKLAALSDSLGADRRIVTAGETKKAREATSTPPIMPTIAPPAYVGPMPDRERQIHYPGNPTKLVSEAPVSTFSLDVDTASYALVRRDLQQGRLPHPDLIRTEELVNYFDYRLPAADSRDRPFSLSTEIAPSPWNPGKYLLAVGVKAYAIDVGQRPPLNLTLLIDTSGSMQATNKLPLLKQAMRLLVQQLEAKDRVSIVTYAGSAGLVLPPTPGSERQTILNALEQLHAGGSTNGSAGIHLAYQVAAQAGSAGRSLVMLATDGDLNVGITSLEELKRMIENQRRTTRVAFSTLGFGSGNYNDALMSELSQLGDGSSHYIDTLLEARKALVENLAGTLYTVAADAKVQIEWNPQAVSEYRLVGYENRLLAREDFNNDQVDAGDIGSGHSVMALYEISLRGAANPSIDPLRYQTVASEHRDSLVEELAYLKVRYKRPGESRSQLVEKPLFRAELLTDLSAASDNLRWATAVAGFAELLKGSKHLHADWSYPQLITLAQGARGTDPQGYRAEFLRLAQMAGSLHLARR